MCQTPGKSVGLFESRRETMGVKTHMAERSHQRGPAGDGTNGKRAARTRDSGKDCSADQGQSQWRDVSLKKTQLLLSYCQTRGGHSAASACPSRNSHTRCGAEGQGVLNYMWNKRISLRRRAAVFWGGNRKGDGVWEPRALREQESSGKR